MPGLTNELSIEDLYTIHHEKLELEWVAGQQGAKHAIIRDEQLPPTKKPSKKKSSKKSPTLETEVPRSSTTYVPRSTSKGARNTSVPSIFLLRTIDAGLAFGSFSG